MTKRHTKRPTIVSIAFLKRGILVGYDDGRKELVGDPIRVAALGTGIQDVAAYTVVKFKDRDGKWRTDAMRSSLLTAKTNDFKAELTDRHYRWPARKFVPFVIDALAAENPKRRIAISMVPGWQGSRYVLPHKVIKRDGDDWECVLADNPNVRLGEFLVRGNLEDWQNSIARHCRLSSRLRLAVGVPFAATILRRVHLDSFGIHIVGDTSSGKTLCLRVAGSVPGFNSDAGPTSWDGSLTGIEQLALGTRDNVTVLDETEAIEGNEKQKAEFVKLNIFKFAKNQQRLRAGHYTRAHTVQSDTRNIVMSSGEDILIEPRRVRGQDVRMIHLPAGVSDFDDIFDADDANRVGETLKQREKFVSELETATREFQGHAQMAFLRRLVNDSDADKTLARYMEEFIENAPLSQSRRVFARLRRRFAALYAGIALAIDYQIQPFAKEATFKDIQKCMNDAIDLLSENESRASVSAAPHFSDDTLITQFRQHLIGAKFIKAGAFAKRMKSLTMERIKAADGFINFIQPKTYRVMLQTRSMRAWYPDDAIRNRLVALLRNRKMILPGRQPDTCSRQVSFMPYPSAFWNSAP